MAMHMMMVIKLMIVMPVRMFVCMVMVVAMFIAFNMGLPFVATASHAHDTFLLNKIWLNNQLSI